MSHLEQLTELQKSIGYAPGVMSPVAVLGLMGEVGEVVNELCPSADTSGLRDVDNSIVLHRYTYNNCLVDQFMRIAKQLDDGKKQIRKSELLAAALHYGVIDDDAFDEELSDVFYYLNAIAIGRGLTIEDLARTSHAKVLRKRATIGPELTGK